MESSRKGNLALERGCICRDTVLARSIPILVVEPWRLLRTGHSLIRVKISTGWSR
jgi:hypothetical protein